MKHLLLAIGFVLCVPLVHAQKENAAFAAIVDSLSFRRYRIHPGDVEEAARIVGTADSLYEAASEVQDRKYMLEARWFRIAMLHANRAGAEEYKNFALNIADLALELGDTVAQATYTSVIPLHRGMPRDTCIKYLHKACAIVRACSDTTSVKDVRDFYGLRMGEFAQKGDLYLLYQFLRAALADPTYANGPRSRGIAYGYLIGVFQAAERADSTAFYIIKLQEAYVDAERTGTQDPLLLSMLLDAGLKTGGDMSRIIDLVRRSPGALETAAEFRAQGLDRGMEQAPLELRDRWKKATIKYADMGRLFLGQHMLDSAVAYLSQATALARLNDWWPMPRWGTVELELGEAYLGLNRSAAARTWFEQADSIAVLFNTDVARRERIERNLWRVDSIDGNWAAAAKHLYQAEVWADSLSRQTHQNAFQGHLFEVTMQEEKRQAEHAQAQVQEDADRQRFLRNASMAVAGTVLLLLAGLWRQRNRIRKEKQRSEELLLNILPEEVAEELKTKGSAEAVHIDQVTVLFTDFKGFTAMSEVVTPQQLVRDLNECFSAFDHITSKYGIEKIKTIGDAYMAAGGLPTPNSTHATDVINAALEMRDFIAEGKAHKIAAGLPYFEIRIGIHTGPVVAGIVGVKKFQYDIWGDTVNTASRMESSGEVGQVNISEATYALVKGGSGLSFTPRGRVQAKGKGEMEMYFVAHV